MPFTRFQIPKRPPQDKCYARIRVGAGETYCETPTSGRRCPTHDASELVRKRWEKVRHGKATLERLAAQLQPQPGYDSYPSDLAARIRALSAVIEALETKDPLSLDETKLLRHLNKTLNDLITTRLRLERSSAHCLDAHLLYRKAIGLFDQLISDESVHTAVVEGFGRLLDELVGRINSKTTSHETLL